MYSGLTWNGFGGYWEGDPAAARCAASSSHPRAWPRSSPARRSGTGGGHPGNRRGDDQSVAMLKKLHTTAFLFAIVFALLSFQPRDDMINDKCHTAQACASIGELAHMTTVDVLNIIHALRLRNAKTPLQQQGRADVAKALDACHTEIMGIWVRDEA